MDESLPAGGRSPASDAIPQHVAIIRWPEEGTTIQRLRAAGTPRLLVVAPDMAPPETVECDEDWIRLPASDEDLRVRMQNLAGRAARHVAEPVVKGDGRLAFRGAWVPLSEVEEAVARTLAERFGEVVDAATLAASATPALSPTGVRVHIMRLRERIKPLGLTVRTVRRHGYVLDAKPAPGAAGD